MYQIRLADRGRSWPLPEKGKKIKQNKHQYLLVGTVEFCPCGTHCFDIAVILIIRALILFSLRSLVLAKEELEGC